MSQADLVFGMFCGTSECGDHGYRSDTIARATNVAPTHAGRCLCSGGDFSRPQHPHEPDQQDLPELEQRILDAGSATVEIARLSSDRLLIGEPEPTQLRPNLH